MWLGRDRERMVGRFFLENVWSKAHSWDDGNLFFQATYAESKLFGQIDGQPRYSAGGFARGGRDSAMSIWARFLCWLRAWNIMEWAYPTSHARPIHSTRWKVESMPPCCEFVCCQDQRFLPLLHRCVMAVASPVVVLLVDLQLRQQSIPLSFEVPCFAAPTKETERERERSWMIVDEQLDELKNLLMGWNGYFVRSKVQTPSLTGSPSTTKAGMLSQYVENNSLLSFPTWV